MNTVDDRLRALGIELPEPPAPEANYLGFRLGAGLLFIAGQGPVRGSEVVHAGQVGRDLDLDAGRAAARLCAVNILAHAKAALGGDLERIRQTLKVQGLVCCGADFADHPKVIDGASDLLVAVLGEAGRHARFAVGAPSLPFDIAVEVDAVFEVA